MTNSNQQMTKQKTDVTLQEGEIEISKIAFAKSNEQFIRPLDDDFVNSIKKQGVLQSVLVRPKGDGFELVCGERRIRGAMKAGLTTIPARIKDLTDEQAIDAQLTENLERADITPMQEARAYKALMENLKKTGWNEGQLAAIHVIADRFGKKAQYIAQRLELNNLVPELVKKHEDGKISLANALQLCRLPLDVQNDIKKDWQLENRSSKDLQAWIETTVLNKLDSAPWKKDDIELVKKAGSCNACAKRTGANPLLFGDAKTGDCCLDSLCFDSKLNAFIANQIKELIETKPDVVFLVDYGEVNKAAKEILDAHKIKALKKYDDFETYGSKGQSSVTGFYISGGDRGKTAKVFLSKQLKAISKGSTQGEMIQASVAIEGIKERTKRAAELDDEKVYTKIVEALNKSKEVKTVKKGLLPIDWIIMRFLCLRHNYQYPANVNDYDKMKDEDFTTRMRNILLTRFASSGTACRTIDGKIIRAMADALIPAQVKVFEKEQAEIRAKREGRAKDRIAALKAEEKPKNKKDGKAK